MMIKRGRRRGRRRRVRRAPPIGDVRRASGPHAQLAYVSTAANSNGSLLLAVTLLEVKATENT